MTNPVRRDSKFGLTQILLLVNAIIMFFPAWKQLKSADYIMSSMESMTVATSDAPPLPSPIIRNSLPKSNTTSGIGSIDSNGFYFVHPREGERNFYVIGKKTSTDKVTVPGYLPRCLKNDASCTRPNCTRPECRPWGHHYDTIYQHRLGPFSRDDVEPFQFLEIGFFRGSGFDLVSVHSSRRSHSIKDIISHVSTATVNDLLNHTKSIENSFQGENAIPSKLRASLRVLERKANGRGATLRQTILATNNI